MKARHETYSATIHRAESHESVENRSTTGGDNSGSRGVFFLLGVSSSRLAIVDR